MQTLSESEQMDRIRLKLYEKNLLMNTDGTVHGKVARHDNFCTWFLDVFRHDMGMAVRSSTAQNPNGTATPDAGNQCFDRSTESPARLERGQQPKGAKGDLN